ncbi:hypothetical protein NDU88_004340 [Pleurodeles waltl]|uniref:Uncharacterized protein n=1 Tax=Pleurodeles waltl TaxID=8319 RepID=A0AAV7QBM6_PLEWA|nr:hypothetical protein NDU88_004340 [Pleurodeles waltl]
MGRDFSREEELFRGHAQQRPPESEKEDGCGRAEQGREADVGETAQEEKTRKEQTLRKSRDPTGRSRNRIHGRP